MAELTEIIAIRLNQEQLQAIRIWAKQHNVNTSEVIRAAIEVMTGAKA
jgi:hypothetical protein